ncbi:MAG: amidohydrolase family protein [Candidatus Eisenbacteria bacterium]
MMSSILRGHRAHGASCALTLVALTLGAMAHAATPRVHAITNARIVTAPGQVIEHGTVVMRDGIIVAVGARVAVPADARIWKGDSLTVYAGMIDAFVLPAEANPGRGPIPKESTEPSRGAAAGLGVVRSEYRVIENLSLSADQLSSLRSAGFAAAQMAPSQGILRGTSAVVGLGDGSLNGNTYKSDGAQVIALQAQAAGYPGSLMGAIAVIRQSLIDAKWYRDVNAAYAKSPSAERPETNTSWAALQPVIAGQQNALFVADEMLEVMRAAAMAKEAGVTAQIVCNGDEYKRVKAIAATGVPLIVPVNFPDAPDASNDDNWLEVSTEELRQWQEAPGNPAALQRAGATIALTANGLKDVKAFRGNIGKAIVRGLSESAALAAVTTTPARLLGLSDRLGTIAPGKVANLTVTRGALFAAGSKVREVWVDGDRYEVARDETTPKGEWSLGTGAAEGVFVVRTEQDTTVTLVVAGDSLKASGVRLEDRRLRFMITRGGEAQAYDFAPVDDALVGTVSIGARRDTTLARMVIKSDKKSDRPGELVPVAVVAGNTEPWRFAQPEQPAALLVKNATIWTAGPQGTITGADLLVRAGRIAAVGKGLIAPKGAVVIDAAGKHIAPGTIDEHSHSAILGNVNECTNIVTCEVRIQDVINSESVNLYRQLAGGGTMMHLLHGSCNSIGGQAALIKNKWGALPSELFMSDAPGTVKFALGENPKQSNWGTERTGRYPQTRAGVEQSIRDAFERARDYDASFAEFKRGKRRLPPRRDLQLEALSEIIHGTRLIHCHSYRADEILMLMRLTEQFGFRVNTFTHILEGYKVADEMAKHGASAMGFTDWWQYKQEVIDAIPYNGYLMWDRGVNVGFNSDSDELARRLNVEAAKAIKYGGVPREEAIKMVTLNPAKSLKVDGRVGSIEVGKDADFAIWSGEPMSPYSRCEQTFIEGRKYFDRAADLAGRDALAKERAALIVRAKAAKSDGPKAGARDNWPPRYLEDTDMSGNTCGGSGHDEPFRSETARKQLTIDKVVTR